MKHLRETFTDQEWQRLIEVKKFFGGNWHDFILLLAMPNGVKFVTLRREKEEVKT